MAAVSGGAAAAPATTTASDVDAGDHVYLDPSSDEVETLQFDVTNANTDSITVTVADNETAITELELTDMDDAVTEVETDVWEANLSHSDVANTTEHAVGETYELDVTIEHVHDDNGDGTTSTATETFTHDATIVSTPDEQTTLVSDDVSDMIGLDVEEASDGTIFGIGAEDFDTFELTNNHPNGEGDGYNATTYVFDGDAADAYDDGAEDVDAGDPILSMSVFVQGELVPVYADEAGDLHDDGDAHAVYDTDASELDVELGDDRADSLSTDVTVVNNDVVDETSLRSAADMFGWGSALSVSIPFV